MRKTLSTLLIFLLLLPLSASAQDTPGTVKFPTAVDTPDSLIRASNSAHTTLSGSVTPSATTVNVVSSASFPSSGAAVVDSEIIFYSGKTSTALTGVTRGADSTTAAAHSSGAAVRMVVTAAHHNTLANAIIATQNRLLNLTSSDLPATLENKNLTAPTVTGGMSVTGNVSVSGVINGNGSGITNVVAVGAGTGSASPGALSFIANSDGSGGDGRACISNGSPAVERLCVENDGTVTIGGLAITVPFNVRGYGATPNDGTDDSAAFANAVADLNAAGGGVLFVPKGTYITSGGFTVTAPALVMGEGAAEPATGAAGAVTKITCTSPTAVLFTVTALHAQFQNLALVNTSGTAPSAGAGIKATHATLSYPKVDYDSIYVAGFYDDVDVEVGANWTMRASVILDPVRYGVRVRNLVSNDSGDWRISDTLISEGVYTAEDAVHVETSGGGGISGLKVNGAGSSNSAHAFLNGINATISGTSIFQVVNSSFESIRETGVKIFGPSTGFELVTLSNLEFGMYNGAADATDYAVHLKNVRNSFIVGIVANSDTPRNILVELEDCARLRLGQFSAPTYSYHVNYSGTYTDAPTTGGDGFNPVDAFSNSWANASGWGAAGYGRLNGKVELKGTVTGGTLNSAIFTIPVGFRPRRLLAFKVFNNGGVCTISIDTDGVVSQSDGSSNQFVSLDSISYWP